MSVFKPSFPEVSIHAPTRGATQNPLRHSSLELRFNPRSHEGSDALTSSLSKSLQICFNPRSHEGSDQIQDAVDAYLEVSIHAPTRGATLSRTARMWIISFQSTLPRGERHFMPLFPENVSRVSIHAPTRGATADGLSSCDMKGVSIHAPTRGATVVPIFYCDY